ncbi:hypothetical protein DEJ16_07355 [Curtobacterium sp. MCJR17_055]|uniref:hypothetical protein n=1 Tax=unclassified Curtobacterium TaxID=257496 RepID=UPI000D871B9B|nr:MULTISPECIES: hypothetical protein [unclassified Curtobacterium]PYY38116.1 hypothetical protein DEI87_03115 [Curtobacterium sp. MCBD17_029]PYY46263.1 hypothetical protein DEI84_13135 [Curtobacterium sp. MCBD17_023]PYY57141.1 hypothetical protein DEJ16_07355 [Curtobacterium sp. MCJR17_055]PYY61943.1 hypothetical protein DEJ26_00165 [Curtobacterium sp. MCPF17_015]PZE88369.1 hypothetical protein DEI95_15465 [Curtobacterium sp. MCBD17_008]
MSRTPTKPLTIAALALCVVSLTGCSALSDTLHDEVTGHAETRADLTNAPEWMPSDATDITSVTGTGAEDASEAPKTIVFTSPAGVAADGCDTVPRKSAPVMTVPEAPDVYAADTVVRCGDWSLAAKGHRWVAWTPNTGDGAS